MRASRRSVPSDSVLFGVEAVGIRRSYEQPSYYLPGYLRPPAERDEYSRTAYGSRSLNLLMYHLPNRTCAPESDVGIRRIISAN